MTAATSPRVRRTPAPWWLAALVGIPLVLGFIGAQTSRGSIEDDLTQRATQVLQGVGAAGTTVEFDGRDARLTVGESDEADRVKDAVAKVPGVRSVSVSSGGGQQ